VGQNKFLFKEGWANFFSWVAEKTLSCKLRLEGWLRAACKSVFFVRWLKETLSGQTVKSSFGIQQISNLKILPLLSYFRYESIRDLAEICQGKWCQKN
jgi:hypothetical protein